MSPLDDRRAWLDHLDQCPLCPVDLCDRGLELATAVRDILDPSETWEGIYRPVGHLAGQQELPLEFP